MKYVLDSNILIHKARDSQTWKQIRAIYFPKGLKNHAFISFAVRAETLSFAQSHQWGTSKIKELKDSLRQCIIVESTFPNLVQSYIHLDLYSQNKQKSLRLPKPYTARNMGKNDLWIAATARVLQLPLISMDKDFEHLDKRFLNFIYIES